MRDDAWPAGSNVDEVNLLYKTSGSNLARDFYVLPDFAVDVNLRTFHKIHFTSGYHLLIRAEIHQF